MNRKIDSKIRAIAAYYGLTVVFSNKQGKPYSPNTLTIRFKNRSDALHDIAHYAVATDKERKEENFGLGTDPDFRKNSKEIHSYSKCRDIEVSASALGIYWEQQIGMDYKHTMRNQNWLHVSEITSHLALGDRVKNMDINAPLRNINK